LKLHGLLRGRIFINGEKQIFSMAFGLCFGTSIVVAYLSSSIIPGFTVAMGFLGRVNSPPDAVAATSVLKHMKIPKRLPIFWKEKA
jgi:CPA1 family monovalent cation:H+ antiporter